MKQLEILPCVSLTVLYDRLCYLAVLCHWVPKLFSEVYDLNSTFLFCYYMEGDEYLNHIIMGDKT